MSRLVLALVLCGLARAAKNSRDPPVVEIPEQGSVLGREVAVSRNQKATLFLNIPFAQPPLKNLRFAPPQTKPLPSWEDVRNATYFGPACPQNITSLQIQDRILTNFLLDGDLEISEDCLTLNIFIPDGTPPSEGWTVMLWLHSGNFSTGATSLWDGSIFAVRQKVMVVTAAYRLGVFGFLTLLDGNAPGNAGLFDQLAAIEWVQSKIKSFNGNPNNITLFGHGAGGISVGLHVISPVSGKFQAAIAMSGCAVTPSGIISEKSQVESIRRLADRFGCEKSTSRALDCLQKVNITYLLPLSMKLGIWGPVVDQTYTNESAPFLTALPKDMFDTSTHRIPLLIGYTDSEDALLVENGVKNGVSPESYADLLAMSASEDVPIPVPLDSENNDTCPVIDQPAIDAVQFYYSVHPPTTDATILRQKYIEFITDKKYGSKAFLQASANSKKALTWLYRFDYRLKTVNVGDAVPDWVNVPHQYELPFVWGMPYWTSLPTQVVWNTQDKKIADTVMALWSSFAKTKNPTLQVQGVRWDPFTDANPVIMVLDRNFSMTDVSTFDYKAFEFWNDYYPKVLDGLTGCCNKTSGAIRSVSVVYLQFPLLQLYVPGLPLLMLPLYLVNL